VNRRSRRVRAVLLIAAAVVVAGCAVVLYETHALQRVEYATVNERFGIRGQQKPPSKVVVVAIDDKTLDDLNVRWPFRRKYHAQVVRNLTRSGAKVIAYDVQFTEPDVDHPQDDDLLIEAVRKQPLTVMATTEVDDKSGKTRIFGGALGLRYSRAVPSNSNYKNDSDGRIRHVAFRIQKLETFPLAAARAFNGGHLHLPKGNSAWIDYKGDTPSLHRISFSDVYNGKYRDDQVRGKVVVIGGTAPSLQDLHPTSTTGSGLMPGPEIQASAVNTALEDFPIADAPHWLDVLLIVLLGVLTPLVALRLRIFAALAIGVAALAAFLVCAQLAFNHADTMLTVVYATLAGIGALLATALIHGVTVAFEREQARDAFARFVPEAVVDEVLRNADGARLGGVQAEGTVMFSDLRGFTSFAETLEPATVIGSLNRYLTAMSEAILDHGGTLVAYMGDGIMAVFGAPLKQDDHADRAFAAAREMLRRLEGFNSWLREEGLHDGFKMGIGLNSGPVMSGHVGSERRLEYTALGDTTNTAARLEGMTKGTPYQLYVADSTRSRLSEQPDDLVEVGEFEVRGRTATVKLWSLREEPAAPEADVALSGRATSSSPEAAGSARPSAES
jgi:adenylate cyclase